MDAWISIYTDAQTISNYTNKIELCVLHTSVSTNPYGVSCNICTSVTFSATVKW